MIACKFSKSDQLYSIDVLLSRMLTAVNVANAHLDVKYENTPPKFFSLARPCTIIPKTDEDAVSSPTSLKASLSAASTAIAVLWAKWLLVFVIVEFAVCPVASAIMLPPLNIFPAMLSIASGMWKRANDPALCASRGTTKSKSMAAEGMREVFEAAVACSIVSIGI